MVGAGGNSPRGSKGGVGSGRCGAGGGGEGCFWREVEMGTREGNCHGWDNVATNYHIDRS